jgi:hypothetical protein
MEVNDNTEYNSVDFLARFACLYEGVNIACDKAEQLGINTNKSTAWIKPLAFQKYIKARERDMRYQVDQWVKTGKVTAEREVL